MPPASRRPARRLRPRAALAVGAISVLLTLAVAELVVRIGYPLFADYDMEMWRYARELKQPLPGESLPFQHRANRSGIFYGVEIATNSMGLRDDELRPSKPPEAKRILVLGDSVTLGWGVPADATLPSRLEARFDEESENSDYRVVNLGVGNYNTRMEVELLKAKGLTLEPDAVVLVHFVNDVEPVPAPGIVERASRYSYALALLASTAAQWRARLDARHGWRAYYESLYAPGAPGLATNRRALHELIGISEAEDFDLFFVSFPELHSLDEYPFPFATEFVRREARRGGVPFLDLRPAFQGEDEEQLWVSPEDTHPNAEALEEASGLLYPWLESRLEENDDETASGRSGG